MFKTVVTTDDGRVLATVYSWGAAEGAIRHAPSEGYAAVVVRGLIEGVVVVDWDSDLPKPSAGVATYIATIAYGFEGTGADISIGRPIVVPPADAKIILAAVGAPTKYLLARSSVAEVLVLRGVNERDAAAASNEIIGDGMVDASGVNLVLTRLFGLREVPIVAPFGDDVGD